VEDVEVVGVGDVLRGISARALVWGYVDPHGSSLAQRPRPARSLALRRSP
jgi:stage V sporulation protein SpoVS